jgi:hypothetical protein
VIRVYGAHPIVELDFLKALTHKPAADPLIVTSPSLQQSLDWLSGCKGRVAFDIETIGKSIRCIGFGDSRGAICIPFIRMSSSRMVKPLIGSTIVKLSSSSPENASSYWSVNEEVIILDAIAALMSSGIEVVGHNSICFDAPLVEQEFGISIKNHYMDTMHAWHCLYSELPKGLDFLYSVLTNYPNYWSELDTTNDEAEWKYNGYDCVVTYECSCIIDSELKNITVSEVQE